MAIFCPSMSKFPSSYKDTVALGWESALLQHDLILTDYSRNNPISK